MGTMTTSKGRVTKQQATEWGMALVEILEKARYGSASTADRLAARQQANEFALSLPEGWMSKVPEWIGNRLDELC